jgi:hypothetical protein
MLVVVIVVSISNHLESLSATAPVAASAAVESSSMEAASSSVETTKAGLPPECVAPGDPAMRESTERAGMHSRRPRMSRLVSA